MDKRNNVLQLLIVALNGAFVGGLILTALVLVPFWKSSDPQSFLDWFTAYSGNLGSVMVPFAPVVLILSIVALIMNKENKENKVLWGLTILFTLGNILYFPTYFLPTNILFVEQTIAINEVGSELTNWSKYNWQRTFYAMLALITSFLAVLKSLQKESLK